MKKELDKSSIGIKGKDKRWELLNDVRKGLLELAETEPNPIVPELITTIDKLREIKEKVNKQEEELKLAHLISCRERNVYLEKLRTIEEYCEMKEWQDERGDLEGLKSILYEN